MEIFKQRLLHRVSGFTVDYLLLLTRILGSQNNNQTTVFYQSIMGLQERKFIRRLVLNILLGSKSIVLKS